MSEYNIPEGGKLITGEGNDVAYTNGSNYVSLNDGDNTVYVQGQHNEIDTQHGNTTVNVHASNSNGYDTQATVTNFEAGDTINILDQNQSLGIEGTAIVADVSSILAEAGVSVSHSCDLVGEVNLENGLTSVACAKNEEPSMER